MAQNVLVMFPLETGQRVIEFLDENWISITAAFWFYQAGDDSWRLYLASPEVVKEGPLKLYERLEKLLAKASPPIEIDVSDIALISPRAKVIDYLRNIVRVAPGEPGRLVRRTGDDAFSSWFDEAYVYRLV